MQSTFDSQGRRGRVSGFGVECSVADAIGYHEAEVQELIAKAMPLGNPMNRLMD